MAKRLSRRRLLEILAGLPFMSGLAPRRVGRGPAERARPPRRSGMAVGGKLGSAQPRSGGAPHQGALAARRLRRRVFGCGLRASLQGTQESLLSRRRGRADPVARLGRRLDVAPERLRRRRQDHAGRRRRGQFRADEQSAARGQGRRPQLPGNIQRGRLLIDLDAPHERGRRCTTLSSAPAARAARSRSRPCRSRLAHTGARPTMQ